MKVKIGLETHCQLNTLSKAFCSCRNPVNLKEEPEPNTFTCPICLGMPGSKPAVNKKMVELAVKTAIALNCKIAPETYFSRKVYFYCDMNKNFQITQYEVPIALGGSLKIGKKQIRLIRIHMEEDPARLVHIGGLGGKHVLVDYNRAGIPLIEIVTEPDLESPEEARDYLNKLASILEYLGVYDSLSRAVFKSDANISLEGGARIEVKNITGTKEIEQALKYEILRQGNLLKRGVKVKRETRMWNPALGATEGMRGKEEEEEYGYIFEPDLTKIEISRNMVNKIRRGLPELPEQRFRRFVKDYGLPEKVAESIVSEWDLAELFEGAAKGIDPRLAGTWIAGYLKKTLNWHNIRFRESGLKPEWIVSLLKLFREGRITDRNAEMVIRKMVEEKKGPEEIIRKHGFGKAKLDLDSVVKRVLGRNKKAVEDYKAGGEKALHFLVGQVMKETRGQAGAEEIRKAILKALKYWRRTR